MIAWNFLGDFFLSTVSRHISKTSIFPAQRRSLRLNYWNEIKCCQVEIGSKSSDEVSAKQIKSIIYNRSPAWHFLDRKKVMRVSGAKRGFAGQSLITVWCPAMFGLMFVTFIWLKHGFYGEVNMLMIPLCASMEKSDTSGSGRRKVSSACWRKLNHSSDTMQLERHGPGTASQWRTSQSIELAWKQKLLMLRACLRIEFTFLSRRLKYIPETSESSNCVYNDTTVCQTIKSEGSS